MTRPNPREPGRSQSDSVTQTRRSAQANNTTQVQTAMTARGICGRITQWLWSNNMGGHGPNPARQTHAPQPYQSDPLGCKACREWKVACDHARPQCDHCYQQQLLCFYVKPNPPKIKRKTKRPESVPELGTPSNGRRARFQRQLPSHERLA